MCTVSLDLRTFATELRAFLAKMRSPLWKCINTRLLLFGASNESTIFKKTENPLE